MRRLIGTALVASLMVVGLPAAADTPANFDLPIPQRSSSHLDTQQVLTDLGFYRGPLDGRNNQQLRAAVLAFHKATGARRTTTWVEEDWTRAVMFDPVIAPIALRTSPRIEFQMDPLPSNPAVHSFVEVDITNQVAYLIERGEVRAVLGISSGSETYYVGSGGGRVKATTPRGTFTFYRRIDGLRHAPLGVLYRPWYFTGGYAVHGSPEVPSYPASHGCVRVTNWDADWLAEVLTIGMVVRVVDRAPSEDLSLNPPSEVVLHLVRLQKDLPIE